MAGIVIRRSEHAQQYVVVPNSIAQNNELSILARGLLVLLLSLPPGRQVTTDTLGEDNPDSRNSIRKAMRELREAGYVVLHTERGADGRTRRHLEVFDAPQTKRGQMAFGAACGNDTDEPQAKRVRPAFGATSGNSDQTRPPGARSDQPKDESSQVAPNAGKPTVGSPTVGIPALKRQSTNRQSTENSPSESSGARTARGTRIPDDFTVTPDMITWARKNTPGVNVENETERFIDHWRADDTPRARKRDWVAAWRTWMRRAVDYQTVRPSPNGLVEVESPGTRGARRAMTAGEQAHLLIEGGAV
jgi:hypothetical protein